MNETFEAEGTILDGEVIKYDRDEQGNVIGWHKEIVQAEEGAQA